MFGFGPFKSCLVAMGGLLHKLPYRLSPTRKASHRKRLKIVEQNLEALNSSGVKVRALEMANLIPRYSMLSPLDRYTFFHRKQLKRLPINRFAHFTKVFIPVGTPYGYYDKKIKQRSPQ